MPTILILGPYRFFFFSNEGQEPAHVHVAAGGNEAKIWLSGFQLASSYGFKPHELREIVKLAAEHRQVLEEAWNEHFSRQS